MQLMMVACSNGWRGRPSQVRSNRDLASVSLTVARAIHAVFSSRQFCFLSKCCKSRLLQSVYVYGALSGLLLSMLTMATIISLHLVDI